MPDEVSARGGPERDWSGKEAKAVNSARGGTSAYALGDARAKPEEAVLPLWWDTVPKIYATEQAKQMVSRPGQGGRWKPGLGPGVFCVAVVLFFCLSLEPLKWLGVCSFYQEPRDWRGRWSCFWSLEFVFGCELKF